MYVYIFTEDYQEILTQLLPNAKPHRFGGLACLIIENDIHVVRGLAEVVSQILGVDVSSRLEDEIVDFLSENEYIHLDAFIRICLEEIDA